ncbi:hypothetical protein Esti_000908 [Eimeria stiedai]
MWSTKGESLQTMLRGVVECSGVCGRRGGGGRCERLENGRSGGVPGEATGGCKVLLLAVDREGAACASPGNEHRFQQRQRSQRGRLATRSGSKWARDHGRQHWEMRDARPRHAQKLRPSSSGLNEVTRVLQVD